MADLPQPARVLLANVLERASDVAVTVSTVVVPVTVRLVNGAVGSVRHVADDLGRRLGGERRHRGDAPSSGPAGSGLGDPLAPVPEPMSVPLTDADVVADLSDPDLTGAAAPTSMRRTRKAAPGRRTRPATKRAPAAPTQPEPPDTAEPPAIWPEDVTTPAEAHVTAEAELAAAQDAGVVPTSGVEPDDLPVAGWDEMSVASIGQRLRRLGADDVALLLAYERDHSNRPKVVLALERRLARQAQGDA